MVYNYQTCQYECQYHYYIENKIVHPENPSADYLRVIKCVEDCTSAGYCLTNEQLCVNECPQDWFLNPDEYGDRCTATCSKLNYMCSNNLDFQTDADCGDIKTAQAKCCSSACPLGMYKYGNLCVGQCPPGTTKVVDECVGTNKIAMWIWIVISIAIAFIIAIVIFVILLMKKKRKGIQRVKSKKDHSGKTVYYANKIKEY